MYIELSLLDTALRIALAVVFGALIGFERKSKPAGFRTHALVSLGAALFMIASLLLGHDALDAGSTTYAPSRIASTVVQGVGFVAAGVIFASRGRIQGLTTAASIWVTAAIGLLAGAGFFGEALFGTIAVVVVLEVFERFEARYVPGKRGQGSGRNAEHD